MGVAEGEADDRDGADGDADGIVSRPYGKVQVARRRGNAFGRARQELFLEHLAATCNVQRSAEAAGVTAQCVYKRRRSDAGFRAAWGEALEQGYARLEAMLLERASEVAPPQVEGDLVLAGEPLDRELAIHLLREHKKGVAGLPRAGASPRPADWSEVEDYFVGKLKALKRRLGGEHNENPRVGGAPPPHFVRSPSPYRGGDS